MAVRHFLLVYDRGAGALLREQVFERRAEALEERFAEERRRRGEGDDIEIVVVSAPSRDELMRTHARYFLGLEDLLGLMKREA